MRCTQLRANCSTAYRLPTVLLRACGEVSLNRGRRGEEPGMSDDNSLSHTCRRLGSLAHYQSGSLHNLHLCSASTLNLHIISTSWLLFFWTRPGLSHSFKPYKAYAEINTASSQALYPPLLFHRSYPTASSSLRHTDFDILCADL